MDSFTKNPGLFHISEKIFKFLDQNSLMDCRMVNKSWKQVLDQPIFWLKKFNSCKNNFVSKDKFIYWKILAREIDNYHVESIFILILIKTAFQIQSLKNFVSAISLILGNEFGNNTDPTMDRRLQLAEQIDLKEVQVVFFLQLFT